eukprot:gene7878-biopygen16589
MRNSVRRCATVRGAACSGGCNRIPAIVTAMACDGALFTGISALSPHLPAGAELTDGRNGCGRVPDASRTPGNRASGRRPVAPVVPSPARPAWSPLSLRTTDTGGYRPGLPVALTSGRPMMRVATCALRGAPERNGRGRVRTRFFKIYRAWRAQEPGNSPSWSRMTQIRTGAFFCSSLQKGIGGEA